MREWKKRRGERKKRNNEKWERGSKEIRSQIEHCININTEEE